MGVIQADWHVAVGTVDHSDPFASMHADERVLEQDPYERLCALIGQEAELAGCGLTCPLKDIDWAHPRCSSCPERGTAERERLCRIGLAQEEVLAAL